MNRLDDLNNPHLGQPVLVAGKPIAQAQYAMLMLHGRGASAEDILLLADQLGMAEYACFAPQAAANTWYPNRFLAPLSSNEPWLSSALSFVGNVLAYIIDHQIPPERVILLGFSQGACLTLEFAARNARRYGGIIGLSGALIGPDDTPRAYSNSLAGTPVFLGCSDVDPHVSKERVLDAAEVLRRLQGEVAVSLYPNMGHTVNADEIEAVRKIMQKLLMDS